jgi:hypothetical protein
MNPKKSDIGRTYYSLLQDNKGIYQSEDSSNEFIEAISDWEKYGDALDVAICGFT